MKTELARQEKIQRESIEEFYKRVGFEQLNCGRSQDDHLVSPCSRSGRTRSRSNQSKWIVIAQGGDGYDTLWHEDFRSVMVQIGHYVRAIEWHQLDLDWDEICDRVPHLKNRPWGISKDRPWRDYWENRECTMDCSLLDEVWESGMPGESENFFSLELHASQKQSFLKTMGQLRASLTKYWEEHQLPEFQRLLLVPELR